MRKLEDWLQGYLVYTAESESPEVFHVWCGLSAIAGALGRRVFFDMGYFSIYPNLYVMLVSPPGRCRKSTAMRVARSKLASVPDVNFSVDSTTRERLILDMAASYKDGQSAMTAYSSEFATMLTSSGMDMVAFLTDIFDSPNEWIHKTKSGGTNKIKSPCLNLIGGTTPSWIATAMPLDTVGIGLTSRIVFVYSDTPRVKPPIPKLTDAQKALGDILDHDINQIATLNGQYIFEGGEEGEAFQLYSDWYVTRGNHGPVDDRLAGYYERKPIHLIKTCMAVAACRRDELVMTTQDLKDSLSLLTGLERDMHSVFAHVGKNPLNYDIETILADVLRQPKGVALSDLMARFKYSVRKEELEEVIDTLMLMKKLRFEGGRYYAVVES